MAPICRQQREEGVFAAKAPRNAKDLFPSENESSVARPVCRRPREEAVAAKAPRNANDLFPSENESSKSTSSSECEGIFLLENPLAFPGALAAKTPSLRFGGHPGALAADLRFGGHPRASAAL
jgi:hypothetical protein